MGALLPLIVQLVTAVIDDAPAIIAGIKAAVSDSGLTPEQKADLHARLDAASAKVAAVTYSGDAPPT